MAAVIRKNERSWAIELIGRINEIARGSDLAIKRAGGESTISAGRGNTMFPDVVLYGNREESVILQGWELKMPDVPIEDAALIADAQRKADALNLNSCLIWNFTYAVLYARTGGGPFEKVRQWSETSHIRSREDVETYRRDWEALLEEILLEINGYFLSGGFRRSSLGEVISNTAIASLVRRNKALVADALRSSAAEDAQLAAGVDHWWSGVRTEYAGDETDRYSAYAKTVILNWANRIVFAHIIKRRQNGAMPVDAITYATTPAEANRIFAEITARCDFYNVFTPAAWNEILPELTWQDLVELSLFLKDNGIERLEQAALQNVLEGSVNAAKRQINGQFATPPELARILVRLTMRNRRCHFLDCCCGTGTIPRAAIGLKREFLSAREAVETVWACDKYRYPLQAANLSMTSADTVNLASRIFQHNALTLSPGEKVRVVDPGNGEMMELEIPLFGAVASNLPFVPFETIPDDDRALIARDPRLRGLDGRSDLYCYIAARLCDVMEPGGLLGIVTSNSWLGTRAGSGFLDALRQRYEILQVHISGSGRWFRNADVVATILILRKGGSREAGTRFFLWRKSIGRLADSPADEDTLVNSALLERELDGAVASVSHYTRQEIRRLMDLHISRNALFHKVGWLLGTGDRAVPIRRVFTVFRGSRRGWDPLFYPAPGEHRIEPVYLKKVLKNARRVNTLTASADSDAFCCGKSTEELAALGHRGALAWIGRFQDQRNGVGKPLPQALARAHMHWYELRTGEIAEIFTTMNPDRRLFFARFDVPSFVNQRLIGLRHTPEYDDMDLNHALLNSVFTMFYIEASGFGRGLGVLDINKERVADACMPDPKLVSREDRTCILAAFARLKSRPVRSVEEELRSPDRMEFEQAVFRSFGMEDCLEKVCASLLSMQRARASVRDP